MHINKSRFDNYNLKNDDSLNIVDSLTSRKRETDMNDYKDDPFD